ncbi:MAG: ribonuclease Y [Candidatus Gracilibacteria bacterium]|jgi:ribonuclease Y|nr:ribonuclease Y [Candidatus Gracilibacteria bacterium]
MEYLLLGATIGVMVGMGAGFFFKREDIRRRSLELEAENERKIRQAEQEVHKKEKEAQEIINQAKEKSHDIMSDAKDKAHKLQQDVEKELTRLEEKEGVLKSKTEDLEKTLKSLDVKQDKLDEMEKELNETISEEKGKLENISKMSESDAKEHLLSLVERTFEKDIIEKMRRSEEGLKETLEDRARNAIVQSIQKIASEVTSESTITAVSIPNDEMKGRIIGREGRNINAFERITGTDVIVDDTPGVITISGYDLLRRFIAKKSLEKLIEDGRIHPARIEEIVLKTTEKVDKMVKDFGEQAVFEVGVSGLPSELIKILGRLRFRTSYGQNVLKHSIEVALLSEAIANEVGADAELAKKAGLLHDIGKAVSQEVGGKHALISGDICRKFKLGEKLINAIEAHHEDREMICPEAFIVAAADAISASRPGARRETVNAFIKRMKDLEEIASSFGGVDKCFAIQAGREIRVIVDPEKVTDLEAKKISWDIARKIESDMSFPGEIKILVLRETRNEDIAR